MNNTKRMKCCVFLCDKKWQIQKVLHAEPELVIPEGESLLELLEDASEFGQSDRFGKPGHSVTYLRLKQCEREIPAVVCSFQNSYLFFLVERGSEQEFSEFMQLYARYVAWVEEQDEIPYTDEYFHIQQMNNQLINSQRALVKTNQQLKQVLMEIREANSTIALLERDELTNLYNASAFYRRAEEWVKKHPGEPFDIIVLDIENFKLVNEVYGRQAGDRLLQGLSLVISGCENAEKGLMARVSADTFYLLMPEELGFYTPLCRAAEEFLRTHALAARVREKLGVYQSGDEIEGDAISIEQRCDRARLAMDTVRPQQEERIAFYSHAIHETMVREHQILAYLPEALKNREFKLYLQPKIEMQTRDLVGAEALVRWFHPEWGLVPPGQFIPLLERSGSSYAVDRYIWEETCRCIRARREAGLKPVPMSVNVARSDLYEPTLVEDLCQMVKRYGLEAGELRLEIIERAYVEDLEHICRVLGKLRECGFLIEMDDFGTGESSLSMVADMPVDVLKIDRSFVVCCQKNKRQAEVIRFIVQLASALHIQVLAEGVETEEQAEFLRSMGCRYAQGFLYGKPQPVDEFNRQWT